MNADECKNLKMEEKNIHAGERWKALSEEERKTYSETAKNYRAPDIRSLSEEEKKRVIAKHKRQLIAEVTI